MDSMIETQQKKVSFAEANGGIPTDMMGAGFGIHLFSFGTMRELKYLCQAFGISRQSAIHLCKALRVPLFYIGKAILFQQFALERVLYILTRAGGTGFAAPGSKFKARGRSGVPFDVTDSHLKMLNDPLILAEMFFGSGRREKAAKALADVIKKLGLPRNRHKKKIDTRGENVDNENIENKHRYDEVAG